MKIKSLLGIIGALVLIGVILYMSGVFTPGKIKPGQTVDVERPEFSPSGTALAYIKKINRNPQTINDPSTIALLADLPEAPPIQRTIDHLTVSVNIKIIINYS